jgi:hypothetical protein
MSILSASLVTMLADFGVKVLIHLGWKFHDGPSRDRKDRYKQDIKEAVKK